MAQNQHFLGIFVKKIVLFIKVQADNRRNKNVGFCQITRKIIILAVFIVSFSSYLCILIKLNLNI